MTDLRDLQRLTGSIASRDPALDFTPVPRRRVRCDGWSPARQRAFIAALLRGSCVEAACRAVSMSKASAYILRKKKGAESFCAAWDRAIAIAAGDTDSAQVLPQPQTTEPGETLEEVLAPETLDLIRQLEERISEDVLKSVLRKAHEGRY